MHHPKHLIFSPELSRDLESSYKLKSWQITMPALSNGFALF